MPLILSSAPSGGGGGEGTFAFTSTAQLRPRRTAFLFRSYVQLGKTVVPFSFASAVRLKSSRVPFSFTSFVALRPTGSRWAGILPTPMQGIPPKTWEVSCEVGKSSKFSYTHNGENESGTLTVQVPAAQIGNKVGITASLGSGPAIARHLTVDKRQFEETRTREGITTVIRFYNETAEKARSFPLPELVPWVKSPRLDYPNDYVLEPGLAPSPTLPAPPPLRSIGVRALVDQAFAAAGIGFSLIGPDPFEGETWLEKRRDTSTGGRTPADVFGSTYGALGYRLIVRGSALFGVPPGGSIDSASLAYTSCELESNTRRKEAAQVPGRIALSASDALVPAPKVDAPPSPDPDKEDEEPSDDTQTPEDKARSWREITPGPDGFTVSTGYVWNGLLREEQEISIGRVEVKETVDGEAVTRVFDRVLIGDTKTTYKYHPDCPDAVVEQVTTKRGFGYGLGTEVRMVGVLGRMFGGQFSAGDLVTNETEIITQTWYETPPLAGYLRSRTTAGKRLVSVEQEGAEEEANQRGPMQAREYVAQILRERYRRVDPNWHRHWETTGGATIPLYDLDSQEPIRLTVKTGTLISGSEVMRNEPPKVNWPTPAEVKPGTPEDPDDPNADKGPQAEVNIPQRAMFAVEGGGEGGIQATFPMLASAAKLPQFAAILAHANGPRLTTSAQFQKPAAALPGSSISGAVSGVVVSLNINTEGKTGSATIEAESLEAPGITPIPWPAENDRERGTVVSINGQRVTVAIPTGVGSDGKGVYVNRTAYLLQGMTVALGATVEIRVDSRGYNLIASGAS